MVTNRFPLAPIKSIFPVVIGEHNAPERQIPKLMEQNSPSRFSDDAKGDLLTFAYHCNSFLIREVCFNFGRFNFDVRRSLKSVIIERYLKPAKPQDDSIITTIVQVSTTDLALRIFSYIRFTSVLT